MGRMMNYSEKDIENLFKGWFANDRIVLVGQQVHVPVGIIDLLFYDKEWARIIVVEVKKGKAPKETLAQIYGYIWCIKNRINERVEAFRNNLPLHSVYCKTVGIIVAEDIDERTQRALYSSEDIYFRRYKVTKNGIKFADVYDILSEPLLKVSKTTDSIIDDLIRLSDETARKEMLDYDRRLVNNPGGSYDRILMDDVTSKDNIVWKARNG